MKIETGYCHQIFIVALRLYKTLYNFKNNMDLYGLYIEI